MLTNSEKRMIGFFMGLVVVALITIIYQLDQISRVLLK